VLAATLDIRRWLEADRNTPFADRLARDRGIGRDLEDTDPVRRLLAWWAVIQSRPAPGPAGQGMRVERLRRLASIVLLFIGILLGVLTATVAFTYEGRHPVSLFRLFGLLVVLPGVLLLATLVVLPLRGSGAGGGSLAALNIGRWAGVVIDRLAQVELFVPGAGAPLGLATFARWQLLVFAQWLAVGFFIGALGLALLRVVFSDLAFGWSTTLVVDAADAHRAFAALAVPWAAWLAAAVPDLELTEVSRYFRGAGLNGDDSRAARLGDWWPYVLMVVTVYGLLPRLILLLVGQWRLQKATRALLLDDPEVTALLDRLMAPMLEHAGQELVADLAPVNDGLRAPAAMAAASGVPVIIWNRACGSAVAAEWLQRHLGVRSAARLELSVLDTETRQRAALAELAGAGGRRARVQRVVVVTRGWEPPLLEFLDFLGLVREQVGLDASITVVPIDVSGTRVEAADRAVWATTLGRLRDPRLYVQEPSS